MRPLVLGHRGASAHALENTLTAFVAARECGADGVELDVRLTRDGVLAVFHDDDLARIAGRPERIAETSWADLSRIELPGGERIPTLEAVLEAMGPLVVNVEIKPPPRRRLLEVGRAVHACVARAAAADRVIVSSFDVAALAVVRGLTQLRCGLLFHARQRWPMRRAWLAPLLRAHAVHPERVLVDAGAVDRWRRRGYQVNVWTVDAPDELVRLAGLGVDGLITNDPAAALAVLDRRGDQPPQRA